MLLKQRPRARSMLWPNEQIYVPHRPVGERGISRVREPGTLEQHSFDIMSSQDVKGLVKQLLELEHLHYRNRRELAQLLVPGATRVSADATQLSQQYGGSFLVPREHAQFLPVDSRAQTLAQGGITGRYSRRQQEELCFGRKRCATSCHCVAQYCLRLM